MTIDFRVAIDWQDNGHVNWLQTADDERRLSYPNLYVGGQIGPLTIVNGTLNRSTTASAKIYGGDFVTATALPTACVIGNGGGITGEISVSASTTYTLVMWLTKGNSADNANDLYIRAFETTSGGGSALQGTSSTPKTNTLAQGWIQHSVTFTTTASTEKLYVQVMTTAGSYTGNVNCSGLMLVAGSVAPSSYNNGLPLLNEITSASIGSYSVINGNVNTATSSTSKLYGLDFVTTTALPTACVIGNGGGITGEISVSASTTYTLVMWLTKGNSADNANDLYIRAFETTSGGGSVLQGTSSTPKTNTLAQGWIQHSVTFKTTGSTEKLYVQVMTTAGSYTGNVNCSGLMLVAGNEVPVTFNDGKIKVLTHRVIDARWNIGYKTSIVNGSVANENRLECSLYNLDDYITEAKYSEVHRVYIEGSDDGGSNWTRLYTGWTRTWMPIFNTNNPAQHMKFTAVSSRFYLDGINARLGVQASQYHDDIVGNIVAEAELPDGSAIELGTGNNIPGTGILQFNYAGQNWTEEVDLLRALADTVGGAGRFCYFDREDILSGFYIGSLQGGSNDYTLTNYMRDSVDYRYAEPWFNSVTMQVYPRKLSSTSDKRLWELPENYSIPANDTVTILARYNDEDKPFQIGARNVTVASSTFSSGSPTITLRAKSTSCYIDIDNTGGSATTLTSLRLEGQKIKTWDSLVRQGVFDDEISVDGNNTLTLDYKITNNTTRADEYIYAFLQVYGERIYRIWSLVVPGDRGEDSNLIDYTVNNFVGIEYPDGSTYTHKIIGEEWAWRGNNKYDVKLYVERLYQSANTLSTRS